MGDTTVQSHFFQSLKLNHDPPHQHRGALGLADMTDLQAAGGDRQPQRGHAVKEGLHVSLERKYLLWIGVFHRQSQAHHCRFSVYYGFPEKNSYGVHSAEPTWTVDYRWRYKSCSG